MVYKKTRRRTSVILIILTTFLFSIIAVLFGLFLFAIYSLINQDASIEPENPINKTAEVAETDIPEVIKKEYELVDFQPTIDSWANSIPGNKSILIYDIERDEVVGSYMPDNNYSIASLYKLFVVYEGYRRIETGEWDEDSKAGVTGKTILECLDLSIRESNSECAETLWSMIGRDNLEKSIINDYKITDSNIPDLVSNPSDILKIMQLFYNHPGISDPKLISLMKDSFLNQPVTVYDWRQGLPSGFSRANVYNKVGWEYDPDNKYWNLYHDAAIVEFPEDDRHFIVVVMTNFVPFEQIRKLGALLEETYYY